MHITDDPAEVEALKAQWERWGNGVELVVIDSPYRALAGPLIAYIDALNKMEPGREIAVVLTEVVPRHFWEWPLHNQTALRIKAALLYRPGIAVTSFPYQLAE